jgi:hypothetical protein
MDFGYDVHILRTLRRSPESIHRGKNVVEGVIESGALATAVSK